MPFGLGPGELILVLLVLAVPAAGLLLAARFILGRAADGRSRRDDLEREQLAAELRRAQARIDELEARVTSVDEKASFTQELLENPRPGA